MTLILIILVLLLFCFSKEFRGAEKDFSCLYVMLFLIDCLIVICGTIIILRRD